MNLFKSILVLILIILSSKYVSANQWDEYSAFMDQFYLLNKQSFSNISCKIDVSNIDDNLELMRTRFKPLEGKIKIAENISDFRLSFTRDRGLKLNQPYFDVRMISDDGIQDRNMVETALKDLNNIIQQQLSGTSMMLQGLFSRYISPREDDIKIIQIVKGIPPGNCARSS